jgi:biotin carboxyl carrier protein
VQYEIEIGGRLRRAIVHRADGRFLVEIDGKQWAVDAERLDDRSMSLLIDASGGTFSHEVMVAPDGASGQLVVSVGTKSVTVSLNSRRRGRRQVDGAQASGGSQRIVAPMPGKIVRVLVKQGDPVQARQPVLVIEAMKMENELRAQAAGRVKAIVVTPGTAVEKGALLIELE